MIENKYINKIIIGFVVIAVIFTSFFMFRPSLLGIKSEAASPKYADKLFPENEVTTIDIKADEDQWKQMLENATDEEYIPCDITINGETFHQVGIRPKGNSSLSTVANSDSDRYSFKIKMDKYVDGQTYYGLRKFVVNNMQGDSTYMKEYLSYDMLRSLGISTPLCSFADITLNGKAWGFYLAVESEEENFAERNFGVDYGMLYKPESMDMAGGQKGGNKKNPGTQVDGQGQRGWGNGQEQGGPGGMPGNTSGGAMNFGGQPPGAKQDNTSDGAIDREDRMNGGFGGPDSGSGGGADLIYSDDDADSYSQIFDNSVFDAGKSDKKRVIAALKGLSTGENLEKYIDVDEVARYFAANTALVNLDSYVSSLKHNYYLYEKDGILSILPWDLNLSFAGFQSKDAGAAVNFPIDTPVTGVSLSERPLIGMIFENDKYTDLYHSYLQKIVDEYFNSGHFAETIDKLDQLIGSHVKDDPSAFYTYDQYQAGVKALKEFGLLRAESIEGQLNGTVPPTSEEQTSQSTKLIDAAGLNLSDMGSQGGGGMNRNTPFSAGF